MLLPKLFGNALWISLVGLSLLLASLNGDQMLRRKEHRTIGRILSAAPWVYWPLVVLVFVIAYQLDKRSAARLLEVGVVAPAVVVEVRDTGVELGVNPVFALRIRVSPSEGEPFESEVQHVPSRPNMGTIQEGMQLRVRYDPRDRSRIAVESGP